jgi:hypothetical protein
MPMEVSVMAAQPEFVEPEELNAQEFRALLEARIRVRFRMSIEGFVEAVNAGELHDDPAATEFAILVGASSRPD